MSHFRFLFDGRFALVVVLIFFTGLVQSISANEDTIKQEILNQLTPEEHHLYFGGIVKDPEFYLVVPSFAPSPSEEHPGTKRLIIRYDNETLDVVMHPAEGLLAPHVSEGIYIDGELVKISTDVCHYRFSNKSVVLAINDCHPGHLDGVMITEEKAGTLHALPSRLRHLLLPDGDSTDVDEASFNSTSQESTPYDFHIFHLASKSYVPASEKRNKRSASEPEGDGSDEVISGICATDDEHDMTGKYLDREERAARLPQLRSFSEIMPDINEIKEKYENGSFRNELDVDNELRQSTIPVIQRKTIELAVFCDDELYKNFPQRLKDAKSTKMIDYILTMVNAIQGIYHQEELEGYILDILIVKLDIQTSPGGPSKSGGDIGAYLSSFCDWQTDMNPQGETNPRHWDHAIMLSGLDLHSSGNPSVIGLAWVSGMCRTSISCTMNEGRSFLAVYVVAHEMGHNLGMNHDGQGSASGCNNGKYIMSPSVGPGKTTWSRCSVTVVRDFLRKSSCLDDGDDFARSSKEEISSRTAIRGQRPLLGATSLPAHLAAIRDRTPGHRFTLLEQCQSMHGRDYFPALTKFDLCHYLYCTNGILTKPAHPALEGSPCGSHRICLGGECRPEEEISRFVNLYGDVLQHSQQTLELQQDDNVSDDDDLPSIDLTGEGDDMCSCAKLPLIQNKPPKELCPLFAESLHPALECSLECTIHDLFIQLQTGKMFKVINGTVSETFIDSCLLHDQNLALPSTLRSFHIPLEILELVCRIVPSFLRPQLKCPETLTVGDDRCLPEHIILSTGGYNFTYVLEKEIRHTRRIQWRGHDYSLVNTSGEGNGRSSIISYRDLVKKFSELTLSNCEVEEEILDIFKVSSPEFCPFLATALHPLVNCEKPYPGCREFVTVVDFKRNSVTKYPVSNIAGRSNIPDCNQCPEGLSDLSSVLSNLIISITTNSELRSLVCPLIPDAWFEVIPACARPTPRPTDASDEICPAKTLLVLGDNFQFTYDISRKPQQPIEGSSITFRGTTYHLLKINYAATSEEQLKTEYNLDLAEKFVYKLLPTDIERGVLKRTSNYRFSKRLQNFSDSNFSKIFDNADKSGNIRPEKLQEYIGQHDAFLAANSPQFMHRTNVGPCSVTCGQGVRPINIECVDVATEEVVDDQSCQGFIDTEVDVEPCYLPPCATPRWFTGDWGPCSETCGSGVQYREVTCSIEFPPSIADDDGTQIRGSVKIVVESSKCRGKSPRIVRDCTGDCKLPPWCENEEDCFDYRDVQISKDFDY